MPTQKKIIDPIRVKILSAMRQKRAISPNIKEIQKITGFHRATIKSSIAFLEENKFIEGYRPLLNTKVSGYKLNSKVLFQVDLSDKKKMTEFLNAIKEDRSVVSCSHVITDNQSNIFIEMLSKNIEDYYKDFQEKYYQKISNIYDFIKNRSMCYLSEPTYKKKNEIDTLIDLLEQEVGE
jgi:DNA-binding Lrp family transcriptional regulator